MTEVTPSPVVTQYIVCSWIGSVIVYYGPGTQDECTAQDKKLKETEQTGSSSFVSALVPLL